MKTKALEIRDRGTFIAALAVDMNPENDAQHWLLRRCGYPCDGVANIALTALDANGSSLTNDPWAWNGRTWQQAHMYILLHWDELADGDVVDVEYILGETKEPKVSERVK